MEIRRTLIRRALAVQIHCVSRVLDVSEAHRMGKRGTSAHLSWPWLQSGALRAVVGSGGSLMSSMRRRFGKISGTDGTRRALRGKVAPAAEVGTGGGNRQGWRRGADNGLTGRWGFTGRLPVRRFQVSEGLQCGITKSHCRMPADFVRRALAIRVLGIASGLLDGFT